MAMNTNAFGPNNPSDDELLAGVRRHMTGVESLVPLSGAWEASGVRVGSPVRVGVRSRVGFAGLVPLVLVAALVVVAVGYGMGARVWTGAGSPARTPTTDWVTINCELVSATGQKPTAADVDLTVSILMSRLQSAGVEDYGISAGPASPIITVSIPATADVDSISALILRTGRLEFVWLPPADYGTADAAGRKAVPAPGASIDPALPAQFAGADLDPAKIQAVVDTNSGPESWKILFGFTAAKASEFETWSGAHVKEYFAIVVDGVAQSVPYIFSAITGGSGEISGNYTKAQATYLAAVLRAGPLPYPLVLQSILRPGETAAPSSPSPAMPEVATPTVRTPTDIPSSGRTLGNANAPVTLDVYVDFQCSACRSLAEDTQSQLIANYVRGGKVKIVYHDFVVIDQNTGGHDSEDAADAARIAADQGKFWAFSDYLWANQQNEQPGEFSRDMLIEIARMAGLDVAKFTTDLDAGKYLAEVRAESAAGQAAGITGTPTILVNGKVLDGSNAASSDYYATISAAIDRNRSGASPSATAQSTASAFPTPVASPFATDWPAASPGASR